MPSAPKTPTRLYGPAELPNATATRYTVPSGIVAVVRQIHLQNPAGSGGPLLATISIGADAAGTRLFRNLSVAEGATYDHFGYWVLVAGEVIQGFADQASLLVCTIFGDQRA